MPLVKQCLLSKGWGHDTLTGVMKADIHPTYCPKAKITCACGQSFTIGSTVEEMHVEICSACHPFFTGKQKLMDSAGRVDRFRKRAERSQVTTKRQLKVKSGLK